MSDSTTTQPNVHTSNTSTIQKQQFHMNDGVYAHFASSMLTGMIVTCVMNPADVVSTRLYNQPVANGRGTLYSGVIDCAYKTLTSEGPSAFFKYVICLNVQCNLS